MLFFFSGIFWLILVFVLASVAKGKGRSYGGFFAIGLFLTPLIGLIILLVMGENKEEIAKQNITSGVSRKCPFCANEIKREAIVCQFCNKDLPEETFVEEIVSIDVSELGNKIYNVITEATIKDAPKHNAKTISTLTVGYKVYVQNELKNTKENSFWYYIKTPDCGEGWCNSAHLKQC